MNSLNDGCWRGLGSARVVHGIAAVPSFCCDSEALFPLLPMGDYGDYKEGRVVFKSR